MEVRNYNFWCTAQSEVCVPGEHNKGSLLERLMHGQVAAAGLLAPRLALKPLYWEKPQLLPKNSIWQLGRERLLPKLEFNAAEVTSFFQVCIQASHEKTRNAWCTRLSDADRDRRSPMAMALMAYIGVHQLSLQAKLQTCTMRCVSSALFWPTSHTSCSPFETSQPPPELSRASADHVLLQVTAHESAQKFEKAKARDHVADQKRATCVVVARASIKMPDEKIKVDRLPSAGSEMSMLALSATSLPASHIAFVV